MEYSWIERKTNEEVLGKLSKKNVRLWTRLEPYVGKKKNVENRPRDVRNS